MTLRQRWSDRWSWPMLALACVAFSVFMQVSGLSQAAALESEHLSLRPAGTEFTYDSPTCISAELVEGLSRGPSTAAGSIGSVKIAPYVLGCDYDPSASFVAPSPTGIRQINGRNPINSSYAGRVYDGPGWTADLGAKYPNGVRFNDAGFPDFSPYSRARVQFDDLTGSYATDAAAANRALNLTGTPSGHVWHHVEDGTTMILIPQDIHSAVRHTGGAAVLRGGG